ncbi:hypothetical protein A2380_03315 [candidate division WWE3 bacterium RIFOXYB1_FULL_43_24]|uniref:Integral membrane protein n=2 Tax=Katanobacteria TaxID=422282 RepID=A0A0G0YNC9_UNCKA|nr:MAG: hypothetical protein UU92_C0009G0007 [candidate division WWE3 bacterium GW2011_GWA1_42_12]KKS34786.1 MAG: hypothetical protein UU97_C0006G0025 [candidate division WWE3 bacterium GW2011_GWD1_42_14]KKS38175.1 MAG: hypothetical protein UV00_C0008G0007 [candidate division WWE3 bacterium GW2011_GWF1_42_14]KKS40312.1 MAG: hypothetical protein UV03_C0008G0007 [candidate division WWE3 bacterium GW2011_GWE1_42_16]KKS67147.1 MAG: hypothetical protein UV35_C0002G0007 [candidate division WWE3 bacte
MKLLLKLVIATLAIFVASRIIPGVVVEDLVTAIIVAIVLGTLNLFVKPILILLTLPINLITFGLFTFIISAFIVLFTAAIVPGFQITSIWTAILFSIVVSIINSFLNKVVD